MPTLPHAKQLRDAVRQLVVAHGILHANRRPCGAPLSVPHAYAAARALQAPDGLTTTALATQLSIDRTNVSRLVTRMEDARDVKRRADSSDARNAVLTATAYALQACTGSHA